MVPGSTSQGSYEKAYNLGILVSIHFLRFPQLPDFLGQEFSNINVPAYLNGLLS